MLRTNTTQLLIVLVCFFGLFTDLSGQNGNSNPNLSELPITLSWDNDGVRITAKKSENYTTNLLELTPYRYLDQIGNDLIRVTLGTRNTPVVIDLTGYYHNTKIDESSSTLETIELEPKIGVYMPDLTLSDYNEPNSFIVELQNFSSEAPGASQAFLFKGLDVLYVGTDECASRSADQNKITVEVGRCDVKHLMLKGGILALDDVEEKIPALCRKYNDRYYASGRPDAFICLQDCRSEHSSTETNLRHSRSLVTKYNITDFEDAPISFLKNMIITKKGVGLNLKTEFVSKAGKKSKKVSYNAYDKYRFFPWYEFINLNFEKYVDDVQLVINDPYNNSYIYNSKVYFSNVELIQFFNELKALISARLN